MRKFYICSLLLLIAFSSTAQDWKKDLLAMNKTYMDVTAFSMNIQVQSFANATDSKPMLDYKGKVASCEGNYYTSLMGKTSLYNKHCMLLVDNQQKLILYKKNTGNSTPKGGFSLAQLDSALILMGNNVSVKYMVNTPVEKRLLLSYKNNTLSKVEISINPKNNTIVQLIYYYNTKQPGTSNSAEKVVMNYTDIELNKDIENSFFSEKKFVSVKKDKVTPTQAYARYQVMNQDLSSIH